MAEPASQAQLLHQNSAFVTALLHTTDNLIIVLDKAGCVVRFNRACEEATGYDSSEVMGQSIFSTFLLPSEREEMRLAYQNFCEDLSRARQINQFENTWLAKDGSQLRVEWKFTALFDDSQNVQFVVSVGTEVSNLRRTESALRESQERFRAFMNNTPALAFIKNRESRYVFINRGFEKAYGVKLESFAGRNDFDILPPDEARNIRAHDARVIESGRPVELTQKSHTADGEVHHWLVIKFPLQDEDGEPMIGGVALDVTARRLAEEALRESEERYSLAMQGANDGVWDWNLERDEIYFSSRWKSMLGYEENDIGSASREWLKRVHPADCDALMSKIHDHLHNQTPHFECEYRILHKDGTYRWMLARGLAIRDGDGKPHRMAGSQTDMTERKVAEQQLLHDVFHDALTGLPNRVVFLERVAQMLARAKRRDGYCFAVLFLDLNNFKNVNDTLGHLIGDQLLQAIAARLKRCLRRDDTISRERPHALAKSAEELSDLKTGTEFAPQDELLNEFSLPTENMMDMVARLGGDEFTVVLEDVGDVSDVQMVAKRIYDELDRPFNLSGQIVQASLSIGIVMSSPEHQTPNDLISQADSAMYEAKEKARKSGRSHISIFQSKIRN